MKGIIIKGRSDMKDLPLVESCLSDELLYGMTVEILDKVSEEWYFVNACYGYKGMVRSEDILEDVTRAQKWEECALGLITAPFCDVVLTPSYKNIPLITLPRGSKFILTGELSEDWQGVELANGICGWIRKEHFRNTSKREDTPLRQAIITDAMRYMGCSYRWGGKSPMGIDCSGLTFMSYWMNGVTLYRDAVPEEFKGLKPISRLALRPADLIFFPGHIALYLGGDRYIHATGKNGAVVINSLNPDHPEYRDDLATEITYIGTVMDE